MGILNVTPDSFAEPVPFVCGGRVDVARAVDKAERLIADGADLLDIGGESTRPGADPVSAADELARVLPVLRELRSRVAVPISIDTYKADVARETLAEGANLVNDVSGLLYDPSLAEAVHAAGAGLILMHTRGRSQAMYAEARYDDLAGEVIGELDQAMQRAVAAGVPREAIIVDPGIGFAKRSAHSYGVLAELPRIAAALGRPVLAGPSRKSFMRDAIGDRAAADRDWGTAAAVTASVLAGVHIVRVHAVTEMTQVVRVAENIRSWTG